MRFSTTHPPFYCGIDWHARRMYVCIVNHEGAMLLHRHRKAAPEPFLQAVAPYRDRLVVAVEGIFPWYWLADLCAAAGLSFVLGHALSMKAIHGGKAKNDKIASHKIAVLLRGGMRPQASVYPAPMRATRDLLRRRTHLTRKRAALLAHVHNTNSQYNLPEIGNEDRLQSQSGWGGRALCRSRSAKKHRGRPGAHHLLRPMACRSGAGHPQGRQTP